MMEPPVLRQEHAEQDQRAPRLLALRPVIVEAHWHLADAVERFYGELIGLGMPACLPEPTGALLQVYRNDGPDLLVRLSDRPTISANRTRAIIEVPDLSAVRQRLDDGRIEYQPMHGWYWPDQRLGLNDPSGNRLEIKRLWQGW